MACRRGRAVSEFVAGTLRVPQKAHQRHHITRWAVPTLQNVLVWQTDSCFSYGTRSVPTTISQNAAGERPPASSPDTSVCRWGCRRSEANIKSRPADRFSELPCSEPDRDC